MAQPRTLEWIISTLKWYEELKAKDAAPGRENAVLADSAEAASRIETYRDRMRVSGDIAGAAGKSRIQLLCDELDNSDGLTATNVIKLRAKLCRAKPCALEEANVLSLGEVADVLEAKGAVAGESMADNSLSAGLDGLSHLDLPNIFRCAVELAEAASNLTEQQWADLPANCEGPTSRHFERQMEASRRLRRIQEETERLKRSLGATGPLEFRGGETDGGPEWESYLQRFNNTSHDRIVRLALLKLATAAIDLSGFATWREWQWHMRETGLRLLTWGLAQLWEGMSGDERSRARDRLPRTHKAIGWPDDRTNEPRPYDGPEEIPLPDQYRIVANYISCYRSYMDDVQKVGNVRIEQGQVKFLRRATLAQFIETAERAAQALHAMVKRDCETTAEWGDLYTKAFWPLACLRRAHEIQPREAWPPDALEQRKLLADAADILLTCVGGTAEAKATCNPEEANKAFEDFTQAILRLRVIADPKTTEYRSEDAAYSLGMLFDALRGSESAFAANSRTADRVEAKQGGIAAQWWRVQAAVLKFQPDPAQMPGIDRIQLLCDELDNGDGLSGANVAKIRAKVCRAKPCSLEAANALSLNEVADVLEARASEAMPAATRGNDPTIALMRVFTNGIADDRIEKATRLLANDELTVNEKLSKIDALIPFPATASAEQLGGMLGVTKQAVLKTDWWIRNRKGEKESEVGRRREAHRKRAKSYESPSQDDQK